MIKLSPEKTKAFELRFAQFISAESDYFLYEDIKKVYLLYSDSEERNLYVFESINDARSYIDKHYSLDSRGGNPKICYSYNNKTVPINI